jgi:hypothetical protein
MAAPSFDRAAIVTALGVVSTVAVAYMVYQGSSLAVLDVERTGRLAWAALTALAVLVVTAWLLTSRAGLGLVGVAVAKALAYVVLMAVTTWAAVRHSPLRWPGRLVVVAVASVLLALVGAFLPGEGVGLWLRAALAVLVAGGALALAPGVLRSLRG